MPIGTIATVARPVHRLIARYVNEPSLGRVHAPTGAAPVDAIEHHGPGDAALDPQPGDFILTHGAELFSQLIRFGQSLRFRGADRPFTYWNHAALIVSTDGAIVEALGAGVERRSIADYGPTQYTVVRIAASPEDRSEAAAFAEHCVGHPYGWATIVSIALSLLTGAKLSFGFNGQLVCSGLVARALERTTTIFEDEPSHIMPAQLAKLFGVIPPAPETPKGRPAKRASRAQSA